jgi:16S rRNA (guanine527-N7)-methyltransferase
VGFAEELTELLPEDLPQREYVVRMAAKHLDLITDANRHFNLTRITNPREAAIKHVVDSVLPWRLFAGARHVLDAGTGAGYPGIPLALILPSVRFTLSESVGKKARFVESVVKELDLRNVDVAGQRAEGIILTPRPDVLTARAIAPIARAAALFAPLLKQGTRALLFKGPDAQTEIDQAAAELRKHSLRALVIERYKLPDGLGSRTIVDILRS